MQPVLLVERCYDCATPIPEGAICRRDIPVTVRISGSSRPGDNGRSATQWTRVSLCRRCDQKRAEQEQGSDSFASCLVAVLILAVVGAIGWFAFVRDNLGVQPGDANATRVRQPVVEVAPMPRLLAEGKLDLLAPWPITAVAWIEVDGDRVTTWRIGERRMTLMLPVGEHRIGVKSIADGKEMIVEDRLITIKSDEAVQMLAGYELGKPKE